MIQQKEIGTGKPLGSAFSYLVTFSFECEKEFTPADKTFEPVTMVFDSDFFESDYDDGFDHLA